MRTLSSIYFRLASSEDDSLEVLPSSSGSLWSFSPSAVLTGDSCPVPVSSVLASSATASVDGCERFFSLFRSIPAKERPVTATPTPSLLTNVKSFPSFFALRIALALHSMHLIYY